LAFGIVGAEALALERAVVEPGDGVEEAGVFVGVFFETFSHSDGVEVDKELAKVSGGDLEGGLVDFRPVQLGTEVGGELLFEADDVNALLFSEPILVSAGEPPTEVLGEEMGAGRAELEDDFGVSFSVAHQDIDLVADGSGKVGDFAFAAG
jgi:hypothetical protein